MRMLVLTADRAQEALVADGIEAQLPDEACMLEQDLERVTSGAAVVRLFCRAAEHPPEALRVVLLRNLQTLSPGRLTRLAGRLGRLGHLPGWQVLTVTLRQGTEADTGLEQCLEGLFAPDIVVRIGPDPERRAA